MKLKGPFEIELKIYMTDGEREAVVTYSLPKASFPTEENIRVAIAKSEAETKKQAGKGWRLMEKEEFFHVLTRELTGSSERFAVPGGNDWD